MMAEDGRVNLEYVDRPPRTTRKAKGVRREPQQHQPLATEDERDWTGQHGGLSPIVRKMDQQPQQQPPVILAAARGATSSLGWAPPVVSSTKPDVAEVLETLAVLQCSVDFTKPDGLRTRPLLVENKKIYVCEYYMSIWSPVFRSTFFPTDGTGDLGRGEKQALALPNAKYGSVVDLLECMYPQERGITDQNVYKILPLAFEYQCDEILRRCVDYLKQAPLRHMDKIVLADKFHLDSLLNCCLKQIRGGGGQLDFYSNQYERLSDKTKVRILEKMHHIRTSEMMLGVGGVRRIELGAIPPTTIAEPLLDTDEPDPPNVLAARLARFAQKSELYFSVLRSKSGRHYYCNPYYMAAWSRILAEEVLSFNRLEFDCSALSDEEIAYFLLATHPPVTKLNDDNVHHVLRAACKLESPGVIRRCVHYLLLLVGGCCTRSELDTIEKLVLLDKCYLHELLDSCLRCGVWDLNEALRMSVSPLYECLSSKAKAAILDRIANLLQTTTADYLGEGTGGCGSGGRVMGMGHFCYKCRQRTACQNMKWLCSLCGTYCAEGAKIPGNSSGRASADPY